MTGIQRGEALPSEMPTWHVLWTRSNCERLVSEQLAGKGYETFLPTIAQWTSGMPRKKRLIPMFKGYLFVRKYIDKDSYLDICRTNGLVSILGSSWDRLARVPCRQIESIRAAVDSKLPTMLYPYLKEGSRVRITAGSLANAEGVLIKTESAKGLLVISINLLNRSIAVEVDCGSVVPA